MINTNTQSHCFDYAPNWLIDAGINRIDYDWLKSLEPTLPLTAGAKQRLNMIYVGVMKKVLASPAPLDVMRQLSKQMSLARQSFQAADCDDGKLPRFFST